jgi:hypothetical protein
MSEYPKTPNLKTHFVTVMIADISTAGQIYFVPGFAGKIKKISTVLNGTIDTADSVLTTKIAGTAVTGGSITVAYSGSAAGDIDTATPTAANSFTAAQAIELETGGQSGQTISIVATFELEAV